MELKELLVDELRDLLDAEKQLVKAIPKMSKAAHNPTLKEGFEKHLAQTEQHVERLKRAFELLGEKATSKPCKGMTGLIEEGQTVISDSKEKAEGIADLALIGAAQKVEHYEISAYGTARTIARLVDEIQVADLLLETLGEEEATDWLLTEAAKPLLQDATSAGHASATRVERLEKVGAST
jgi:Mn-containing catalase